jgi:hypothetical protein
MNRAEQEKLSYYCSWKLEESWNELLYCVRDKKIKISILRQMSGKQNFKRVCITRFNKHVRTKGAVCSRAILTAATSWNIKISAEKRRVVNDVVEAL